MCQLLLATSVNIQKYIQKSRRRSVIASAALVSYTMITGRYRGQYCPIGVSIACASDTKG